MRTRSLVILLLLLPATLCAQRTDAESVRRLAEEFENAGSWERAVQLYDELHRTDTANVVYYDGLLRGLIQLKEYDRAVVLVEQRLMLQPRDPSLFCAIAGLHHDAGRESAADSAWDAALALDRKNIGLYHIVASEMLEHRLYDKAIAVFLDGRTASGVEAMFAGELANIYAVLQRFAQATTEYLRRLRQSPDQLAFVQSQMASFFTKPEALTQAIGVVRAESAHTPNDISLRRLLAWLDGEIHDLDAALAEEERIDELVHANGSELASFAQRLIQGHAWKQAVVAYRTLLSRTIDRALVPSCRLGEARATEELSADTSGGAGERPSPAEAVHLYERVAADYPNTPLAAEAMYRIGMIRFRRFRDLAGALEAFKKVREMPRWNALPLDAALASGEVELTRNDLRKARADVAAVAADPSGVDQDQAVLRLAELDYYEGTFDSALVKLARFKAKSSADLANDALTLLYFVQENIGGPRDALVAFARADLFVRQHRDAEALEEFRDIVRRYPQALLVDDAAMRIGDIAASLNRPAEALAAFQTVADSMTVSIWKDRARFRIGNVYENALHDPVRAIEAFARLLADHPTSLYADDARARIRFLRGDRR